MPEKKNPKKLRTISKWKILQNLPSYSTEELHNLPINLSEELIDLYNEQFLQSEYDDYMEYYLRFTNRNKLIMPNTKKLKLFFPHKCKRLFHETIMIVLETCKKITHFSCDFRKQPRIYLHQLVISIPNLIELKLNIHDPGENYLDYNDDKILEEIGNNCFQLEILHLYWSSITDDGVLRFCQSNSAGARIKELNLNYSCVKVKGCLTALLNLKQLTRFYCGDFIRMAFRKLFEDSNEPPFSTFQLCELPTLNTSDNPVGFLSFVTACCPNIRDLHLITANNFDRHIKDIKSVNENVCLSLYTINYVDNIMASLGYVGCRVTELDLYGCDVHLPTIGFSCPNLRDLNLGGVKYMPVNYVARNNSVVAYSKLLELQLMSQETLPIPIEQLQFLLENCLDLQTLKIEFNDEFNDDVMFRLLHVNPLRHLTNFKLRRCNAVTVAPIFELLGTENDLETLVIHNCQNIPILQIDSFIKENNLNVTLDVYGDN